MNASPAHPVVLIVEADDARRKMLAAGMTTAGYEAIPCSSAEEGLRFATSLEPWAIIGTSEMPGISEGDILRQLHPKADESSSGSTADPLVLLLEETPVKDPIAEHADLAEQVDADDPDTAGPAIEATAPGASLRRLEIGGLEPGEIQRRLVLLLVGHATHLEPASDLSYLVGELSVSPFLDIVRRLSECSLTGYIELPSAGVAFSAGTPIFARFGEILGEKAFCRLARLQTTPFRVHVGHYDVATNITQDLDQLSLDALEEVHMEIPNLRSRVITAERVRMLSGELLPHEVLLTQVIERFETLAEVLDQVPVRDGLLLRAIDKMEQRGTLELEAPHTAVRVVTDSTSDLPPELALSHDIEVVPLTVFFGKDAFRDGVDIRARDFYAMLRESESHPRTEPPSEAEFFEHYYDLIERQDVVSIHVSSKMSLTSKHASEAAQRGSPAGGGGFDHLPPERRTSELRIVDSGSVSMGLGLQAIFAARMAIRGLSAAAIEVQLSRLAGRLHLFFAVDTFDFLVRGGRIGRAKAVVGKLLGIRPILGVVDGEVAAVDRALGGRRVHPRIVSLITERIDVTRPIVVCVAHAEAPMWADRLRQLLEKTFTVAELFLAEIGPVVGTHAGPGCVGAVVFQPTDDEWLLLRPLDEA